MASETKNERNAETTDVWETLLARRLANELDSFLATADAETFVFADAANASKRVERRGKRPIFKTLATVAASAAVLGCVASAARFYVVSPNVVETNVETRQTSGEPSLISWSIESLSETEWARQVEAKLSSADVLGLYASLGAEGAAAEETRRGVEKTERDEENETAEADSDEWFSVERLTDVAALEPLKYEPFLQAVAATLL